MMMPKIDLKITQGDKIFMPLVEDEILLHLEKTDVPGKLTFSCIANGTLFFEEGAAVSLIVDEKPMFYGFVFEKVTDKNKIISVTAYDQIRYLVLNKYSYLFEDKRADEMIRMIADDYALKTDPDIVSTEFPIPSHLCKKKTLLDIIQDALNITFDETGIEYIMYDNFGKLALGNANTMKSDILITETTAEDFEYISSIDRNTYNNIILIKESSVNAKIAEASDDETTAKYGVLRLVEEVKDNTETLQTRANALLSVYNHPTRKLSFEGVHGDVNLIAGCLLSCSLNTGEVQINQVMKVNSVTHRFTNARHSMDITVEGGEFSA